MGCSCHRREFNCIKVLPLFLSPPVQNILTCWTLWKHRNHCVFDSAVANMGSVLLPYEVEAQLWATTGAKGICLLTDPSLSVQVAYRLLQRKKHECNLRSFGVGCVLGALYPLFLLSYNDTQLSYVFEKKTHDYMSGATSFGFE